MSQDHYDFPAGPPRGFPKCQRCPYVQAGPVRICFPCAARQLEQISEDSCPVCDQILDDNGTCPNWLCTDPHRRIEKISAIAYSSGSLRNTIHKYKYEGRFGWSLIFARLLIGWLRRHAREDPPEIIIANPTYLGHSSERPGPTERILQVAEREDAFGRWPFDTRDPAVLVKLWETPKSAGQSAAAKRAAAEQLRQALHITNESLIADRRVLVYDDVCTTGSQLNAIAGHLLDEGGARSVSAVVLARAPWRPRPPSLDSSSG
jgi:predicted amidophosphoribosyltransferase